MEEGLNETRDAVNELRGVSHKLAGNTNAISPSKSSQPKTYDELLPKLLPAMRKMCLSQNLRTVEALEWKVNKPSKFAVKGNSKYISEALGWYTNVAVTLKNMKGNPIITIVGNYACVDNGITEIRKVKGISDPIKNQFCIEDHEKTYIISTFSKFLIVKNLPKKEQDQVSTNSSSLTVPVNFLLIHVNLYIRVVLAVKPLSFSPQLTRFLRRDSTLAFQDVSDKLSEEEITSFLLFFSTILVASVTNFSSILTFFFQPFFFGIFVAGRDIDDTSDTALRVIQNREKKRIQDDFDKSKNENKKLSDQMHQFGEKIRQLHSEKNELILQITHKDISLTDAKSRFTIKSEEMMYVSLVQDDLSEMDSIKRKLELKNVELTSENIVTAQKALIEKDSLLQEVNYHLAEQIPKTSSEPEQILKELHNGVIGGISELEQGNEITSLEITSESPY
ncbi:hypothetical protein RhiirA1_477848 [Rhizophagus irregularis]|uniref:Uncharacterized protein n=1 Tax=Rhizophagus irregularis TaxID=588596 RepID=A0A2N0QSY9_9GLOM|nr:hypothetical protein RhiirA1_477848 [Rhizophagus irregularis]